MSRSPSKVLSSIEWQAWVKIYSNLPPDTKVTMVVDHVPLADAMETLAANVDVPPPSPDSDDAVRPNRDRPSGADDRPRDSAASLPGAGLFGRPPAGGSAPGVAGASGAPAGGRGGGLGRGAQWNLAFFVAPTPAQVKQEIRSFESSDPDADLKVYTYGTPMQLVASDTVTAIADPRSQAWTGFKPVDASMAATSVGGAATSNGNGAADPPASTTPTMQTYLQALAQSANIWIMTPGSWTPSVSGAPAPDSSIISAVENLVSSGHGSVTQAIVLRVGRGGPRGDSAGDSGWEDRMRNAINGLPADERPDALAQLNQEVQFRKQLQALPPDQRRQQMIQHFMERMVYGERLTRLSPAKRAQIYARMVAARAAAKNQP